MLLVKLVYFQSMIAAMLTSNLLLHGISTKSTHTAKRLSLNILEVLEQSKLHIIGITSEHSLKLSCYVLNKGLHFVDTGKEKTP